MELVSPAGSAEGVSAAVQSGADAVYVSFGGISSQTSHDITEDEFGRAAQFCRVRGVKIYAAIELSPFDEDLAATVENARRACRMGADAVIVNDIGLIWALRHAVPSMPIFAGTKLNIHNLDGVRLCAAMGVKRVCLPPQLTFSELEVLSKDSPVELEVTVHGPVCPAFPGQCYLSALNGGVSAIRDICPRPCITDFPPEKRGREAFPSSDLCLLNKLPELSSLGIAAVRIDGRDLNPEYTAAVSGVYSVALGTERKPTDDDISVLLHAHPGASLTDSDPNGTGAWQVPGINLSADDDEYFRSTVRRDYLNHEFQRVDVRFTGKIIKNSPMKLTVTDEDGYSVSGEGAVPELAFHHELDLTLLNAELCKTGGTPFICRNVQCDIDKGLFIPSSDIAELRDKLLSQLMKKRVYLEPRAEGRFQMPQPAPNMTEPPALTVYIQKCSQLSDRLLELAPPVIYMPLDELLSGDEALEPFLRSDGISLCAVLPPALKDDELPRITDLLLKVHQLGVNEVLCGNIGHLLFAKNLGFSLRGDYSLNIRNSATLRVYSGFGLKSATLSPEMSASRVRSISKTMDTELVVYGRIPLMYTNRCIIKDVTGLCSCDRYAGISDKNGFVHPVTHDLTCRCTLWSPKKLFLAGRSRDYLAAGLWGVRLVFTTENANECATIVERYLEMNDYEPLSATRALF